MNTSIPSELLCTAITSVRSQRPLIYNITNFVVMNNSANALLAIGASPVMTHWIEEASEMADIASAIVVNIGTLDRSLIDCAKVAGEKALQLGKPLILDPVGAGATSQRTDAAWEIINHCHPTIIRGNASEIMALIDANTKSKGVDSNASSIDALDAARTLAIRSGATVVISGEIDYITNGEVTFTVDGGNSIMASVTGMGCTATALIGAFAAVEPNPMIAATAAMAVMSLAGERAAINARGNGSMQMNFLDELYNITSEKLQSDEK